MEKVNALALQATQKLDDTANRLEVQQDRLQQVTAELSITQQSCDLLEDKLHQAIERARLAEQEANQHKKIAAAKSEALAKREAALAGLSMLMQEPMDQILQNVNDSLTPGDPSLDEASPPIGQTETSRNAPDSEEETLPAQAAPDFASESPDRPTETTCLKKNNFKILPAA
jgi:chromosome segregation ATPase